MGIDATPVAKLPCVSSTGILTVPPMGCDGKVTAIVLVAPVANVLVPPLALELAVTLGPAGPS
jgi:hypothetical protein